MDLKPEAVLIDLSSLGHMIYHVSASEPDPDYTSKTVVNRVHALTHGVDHVGICCDSGRSFRHDLSADYKANRPERDAILGHQMRLIHDQLAADGFPVLEAAGYEADDLIASACAALRSTGHPVVIVTADKDLLQLVTDEGPAVRCKSVRTGDLLDTEAVIGKLGVLPAQVCDYLSLVGDSSDNVKGAIGIGPKTAVELLKQFGTLDDMYSVMAEVGLASAGVTPKRIESLREFKDRLPLTRELIALKTDAPIDPAALLTPRGTPALAGEPMTNEEQMDQDIADTMPDSPPPPSSIPAVVELEAHPKPRIELAPRVVSAELVPYERQLDPRDQSEAITLAKDMFTARVFGAGSAPEALARIIAGREMGIPAATSLRTIKIIDGNMSMTAQLIVAQVMKSGFARYFRVTERTDEAATFETQRGNDPPVTLRFTLEDGKRAFPGDEKAWAKSGWGRNPADMCVARASSKLARLVYPDVCANVYTPEEMAEMREAGRG